MSESERDPRGVPRGIPSERRVVRLSSREKGECEHVTGVRLDDDTFVAAEEALRQMRERSVRFAFASGRRLRSDQCLTCGEWVLR